MKSKLLICLLTVIFGFANNIFAAGPYPATNWPPTIDATKKVHFMVVDGIFDAPNSNWTNSLLLANGGDQAYVTVCSSGFTAAKATSTFINVADGAFYEWATNSQIDILIQVYGDDTVLIPPGLTNSRVWRFREGTTGAPACPNGPGGGPTVNAPAPSTNLHNFKWNWLLFNVTNLPIIICATNVTTDRWVGTVPTGSAGNTNYGGVNGGTIRFGAVSPANWTGLTIHAIAFGEAGAFGATNDVNQFEPPAGGCDPVPVSNLVGIDFNAGVTNHLQVLNDPNQPVTFTNSVGPAGDLRKAVIPDGPYLNFGILSNYLGKPCNANVALKICVDFYDDPAFTGQNVQFGPDEYATDPTGCGNLTYPISKLHLLQGTGQWIRRSWTVAGVNLFGVNTDPFTGGPRFISSGGQVAVSRFYLAALRTTGPLAGQDPLADCRPDPLVCSNVYGDYVELDLANGIVNGLDVGTSAGDQLMVVEQAGPTNDLRLSVRGNSPPTYYVNFVILTNALGPTEQGNSRVAVTITYYDDPLLISKAFRLQTWKYEEAGIVAQGFFNAPPNPGNIVLQGTDKWRDAYWELSRARFDGVNQGPQALARLEMDDPGIHISRVRYAVIRECGTNAGVNLLDSRVKLSVAVDTNSLVRLSWPYRASQSQVQSIPTFGSTWINVPGTLTVEGGKQHVLRITNNVESQFFRVVIPPAP